jgi:hypothetical protein
MYTQLLTELPKYNELYRTFISLSISTFAFSISISIYIPISIIIRLYYIILYYIILFNFINSRLRAGVTTCNGTLSINLSVNFKGSLDSLDSLDSSLLSINKVDYHNVS